jgi:hypothetical protein
VKLCDVVACYAIRSKRFGSMSTLVLVFCAEVVTGVMHGSVEGNPYWIEEKVLHEMNDFRYGYMLKDYREYCRKLQKHEFVGAVVREMEQS